MNSSVKTRQLLGRIPLHGSWKEQWLQTGMDSTHWRKSTRGLCGCECSNSVLRQSRGENHHNGKITESPQSFSDSVVFLLWWYFLLIQWKIAFQLIFLPWLPSVGCRWSMDRRNQRPDNKVILMSWIKINPSISKTDFQSFWMAMDITDRYSAALKTRLCSLESVSAHRLSFTA